MRLIHVASVAIESIDPVDIQIDCLISHLQQQLQQQQQ